MNPPDKKNLTLKQKIIDLFREHRIIDTEYTGKIELHCHLGQCKEMIKTERI